MFHDPMLHETFMTLFPSVPNCYMSNVVWYPSMVAVRNRIELAMMDRVIPQVTSLTVSMPIHVPRIKLSLMANLRRLEVIGTNYCLLPAQDLEWRTPQNGGVSTLSFGQAMNRLDRMLMFIWDHQRLFGTLRELKIENKTVLTAEQPSRLIELVEAMGDRLEVLDVQFWPEAVFYLDRIPTGQLRCLLLHTNKEPAPIFEENGSMSGFLSRCPRLQELSMYTGEKELLKAWRQELWTQGTSNSSTLSTSASTFHQSTMNFGQMDRPYSGTFDMAKMKRINIVGLAQNVIAITNDATSLFASSLEVLIARSWFSGKLTTIPLSWSGLTLSRLTDLDLEGEIAWTFEYASLLSCPRLCRIRLAFTGPMPSRSFKKQPAIDNLLRVFNLKDLELVGNWETLFNRGWPVVIKKLLHLERLDLTGCEGISADHVYNIVRDSINHSAQQRSSEGNDVTSSDNIFQEYMYCYCRLHWVIVSKRLEDGIKRQWDDLKRQFGCLPYRSSIPYKYSASAGSSLPVESGVVSAFEQASVKRIHFSFVVTARPSH
ncbi:hypothetical protein BGZ80_008038 [Entomortierella chlamydospora]|uniref:Uncharacterized protein n=1 Tax=Entomortierella chlamydospora TaxID=101097 RepID=A0A9P6MXM5_9FUNG|nr:hypothetical protein BGZ79_007011 [Entomortierella chlamydospora]KAG0017679.1 hypothetical protein BGZ80_008038 [Entomortierella chlamydospora]